MSVASNVIELPFRRDVDERHALEHDVVLALATADDLATAMDRVVESVSRSSGATRVEWWKTGDDGAPQVGAAIGIAHGRRHELTLGVAGVVVMHGGTVGPELASALMTAAPIIRRRAAEERLARTAIELARRNEALEDFAALVAHELKTPLHAALAADDPSALVEDALSLVDALLEAARNEQGEATSASVAAALDRAVEDLDGRIEVSVDVDAALPLPPGPLRVILRNLLSNAAAAGAGHVHVEVVRSPRSLRLLVDDDGVGLEDVAGYAGGSGIGLSLSRRIASRFGGVLELAPRSTGGTRATLAFAGAVA
jgi:signal transduction histidine kinase